MAARSAPRSAADATRFTSTTPHAASKTAAGQTAPAPSPRSSAAPASRRSPAAAGPGGLPRESPEERVRRLRAAHQAARKAQVSSLDRVVDSGRRFFDVAHRFTVAGLIGFTAIAGLVSIYSVYDMVVYNKKRRAEFIEARRRIEDDELASARLAFINGTATDEQIQLVEETSRRARESGVRLPPLFSPVPAAAPSGRDAPAEEAASLSSDGTAAADASSTSAASGGWGSWFGSGKAKESAVAATQSLEHGAETIRDRARAAFEKEKEDQRRGGALDQIGLDVKADTPKKGWW